MNKLFHRTKFIAAPLILSAGLVACGGGGGSSTPTASTVSITGVVAKGIVEGVTVTAYKLNANGTKGDSVGTGTTNEDGSYSLQLSSDYTGGPIKVEVTYKSGATMKCDLPNGCGTDGNGDPVDFGDTYSLSSDFKLSTLSSNLSPTDTINVTPITTVAAKVAEKKLGDLAIPGEGSEATSAKIAITNSQIADLFGVSTNTAGDLTKVPLIDLTDPTELASASADALKYASLGPAIVEAVKGDNTGDTIEQAINRFAENTKGGTIKGATSDPGVTDLKEIFQATSAVVSKANTKSGNAIGSAALADFTTTNGAEVTDAETQGETEKSGTASDTTYADNITKAKNAVSQVRELGRTTFMAALDGENNDAGAATAFQNHLSAVDNIIDGDYVLEAAGFAIEAIAGAEGDGGFSANGIFDNNGDTGLVGGITDGREETFITTSGNVLTLDFDEEGDGVTDFTLSANRLTESGLTGTWRKFNSENQLLVITFFDDGTYTHAEVDQTDETEISGMEWGTYSLNASTGQLTVTQTFDNNGDTGLTDFVANGQGVASNNLFASVDNGNLSFSIDDGADESIDEVITFERVESEGLLGTWRDTAGENDFLAFSFFNDGTYLHMEVDLDDETEISGMEWGNFESDALILDDDDDVVAVSKSGNTYTVNQNVMVNLENDQGVVTPKEVAVNITATAVNTVTESETETADGLTYDWTMNGGINITLAGTATSADTTLTINEGSKAVGNVSGVEHEHDTDWHVISESGSDTGQSRFDATVSDIDVLLDATMTHNDGESTPTSFDGEIYARLDSIVFDEDANATQTSTTFDETEVFRTRFGLAALGLKGGFKHGTDEFNAAFGLVVDGHNRTLSDTCTYSETHGEGYSESSECTNNAADVMIDANFALIVDANLNDVEDVAKVTLTGSRTGLESGKADVSIAYPGVELNAAFTLAEPVNGVQLATLTFTNLDGVKVVMTADYNEDAADNFAIKPGTVSVVSGENESTVGTITETSDGSNIFMINYVDDTFETLQ